MSREAVVVTAYHSLKDPIIDGLLLEYLKHTRLPNQNAWYHLITFENSTFALTRNERIKVARALKNRKIVWHPLGYHTSSKLLILSKLLDFFLAFLMVFQIKLTNNIRCFVGFTSLSGALAYIFSRIFGGQLIVHCFEPHSLYMQEFGIWKKGDLSYRILSWLETQQVRNADHIIVPTSFAQNYVRQLDAHGTSYVMPISVNENQFDIDEEKRNQIRRKYQLEKFNVILYLGKFDGIYYSASEIAKFFETLLKLDSSYFLFIVTPGDLQRIGNIFLECKIPKNRYFLHQPVPLDQISNYINAADLGLLAVPTLPSQKFRTPIKTVNYLLCGLPYIVNTGISEDDKFALENSVGVVMNDLSESAVIKVNKDIKKLLRKDSRELRHHCRAIAIKHRGLKNTTDLLESIYKKIWI